MKIDAPHNIKAQAAIDFLSSYGFAIIIITVALVIIFAISQSGSSLTPQQCQGVSGFTCSYMFLYYNGMMNLSITQATGGNIVVYGIACSSSVAANTLEELPGSGNLHVTRASAYYPTGTAPGSSGITVPTGTTTSFLLNCYDPSGIASRTQGAGSYYGYIWLNYTLPGTPSNTTQLIASINTQYI